MIKENDINTTEQFNKIAIIDLDSILYASAWGIKIPDGNGDFIRDEGGRLVYLDRNDDDIEISISAILTEILEETESDGYIMYVKGNNTGAHRYKAKSDYKSNRNKTPPNWWEAAKNYVVKAWEATVVDDIEADDAVNITRLQIPNSFIVAIDKDLLHLTGYHYNWKTKEWLNVDEEDAIVHFWEDMIAGQPGDGISGLPGKGKAYYKNIIKKYNTDSYEYDNDFLINLPSIILNEYINHYGEVIGIKEYYQNYTCLTILEKYEEFTIPNIVPYQSITKERGLFDDI